MFAELLENEDLVDVTLAVEGKRLKAHKLVLSICSPYFKKLFKENQCTHPIIFIKDISYQTMNNLLKFMYKGEVQVLSDNVHVFIKTAEALKIKGLTVKAINRLAKENDSVEKIKFKINKDNQIQSKSNSKKHIRIINNKKLSSSSGSSSGLFTVDPLLKINCIPITNEPCKMEMVLNFIDSYKENDETCV